MLASWLKRIGALSTLALALGAAPSAHAATGKCDVSGGDYTQFTGTDPYAVPTSGIGVSGARCMKTIRSLGGQVVEGVFQDGKGRYADELGTYGKLFNMYPGERFTGAGCSPGIHLKPGRNNPSGYTCSAPTAGGDGSFNAVAASANALDWKWTQGPRYNPAGRVWCTDASKGCFGGRCYDRSCVQADSSLKPCAVGEICVGGACVVGDPTTLEACTPLNVKPGVADGNGSFYNPWDALVFDLGGLANKVAIFATNDHGPQPCESNEYTVFLTNNPYSHEIVNDPVKDGANPNKWNRAKLFKIFTHGWIDNPSCCDSPKNCDPTLCTLPAPGDAPVLEADSMVTVFSLPCGITFRYVATISGYDGRSLTDPSTVDDCEFHSSENEVDAVAGLNDDESAICPDKDGDGFPSCNCSPKPTPCDCNDDPALDPNAPKYFPGAPADCDGPQYGCAQVTCPVGTTCHNHQCLSACGGGEYKCPPGAACKTVTPTGGGPETALCLSSPCGDAGACAAGFTCKDGACVDLCASVKCPYGQRCQAGLCVDPCALTICPVGQHCQEGKCSDSCACLAKDATGYPCGGPLPVCDTKKGTCVADGCTSVTCAPGQHCEGSEAGPVCRGACEGVVCPAKQVCDDLKGCVDKCALLTTPCASGKACKDGVCIDATCVNVVCTAPFVCAGGKCIDPSASELCFTCDTGSTQPIEDASTPPDASIVGPDGGVPAEAGFVDEEPTKDQSGCGCRTPSSSAAQTSAGLVGAAFALTLFLSRRRRR